MRRRQLCHLLGLVGILGGCGGGGGLEFETIARDHSSAGSNAHYLAVAGTRPEAVDIVSVLQRGPALEALAEFDPAAGQVLVVFRVGTAPGRNDEVGLIDSVRARNERMEVRIKWTDDGVADDNDEEIAPHHVVVVNRADIPDEAMRRWVAVNSDGQVLAEAEYPNPNAEDVMPTCVRTVPAGYEDLLEVCPR